MVFIKFAFKLLSYMRFTLIIAALFTIFQATTQVILLDEDFSSGTYPSGWSNINNDDNNVHPDVSDFANAWTVLEDDTDPTNFVVASTSYFEPVDRADRWMITAEVTLGASGNFVSWHGRSHDPSFPDSYSVLISTTGDGISDFTDTLAIISDENPLGTSRTFELDEEYANESIRVAFVNTTFNGFLLYLDSIKIRKEDPLSTNDFTSSEQKLSIYPNPTKNEINIKGIEYNTIAVTSMNGATIFNSSSPVSKISLKDVPSGMYLVTIQTNQGILRRKIVKE